MVQQSELDQRLKELVEAIATATDSVREVLARVHASVVQATAELNQIEMFPPPRQQHHAACFDCGKKNLEVFHTSTRHGYHLCPDCFRARERRGLARVSGGNYGGGDSSAGPEAVIPYGAADEGADDAYPRPSRSLPCDAAQPPAGVRR